MVVDFFEKIQKQNTQKSLQFNPLIISAELSYLWFSPQNYLLIGVERKTDGWQLYNHHSISRFPTPFPPFSNDVHKIKISIHWFLIFRISGTKIEKKVELKPNKHTVKKKNKQMQPPHNFSFQPDLLIAIRPWAIWKIPALTIILKNWREKVQISNMTKDFFFFVKRKQNKQKNGSVYFFAWSVFLIIIHFDWPGFLNIC